VKQQNCSPVFRPQPAPSARQNRPPRSQFRGKFRKLLAPPWRIFPLANPTGPLKFSIWSPSAASSETALAEPQSPLHSQACRFAKQAAAVAGSAAGKLFINVRTARRPFTHDVNGIHSPPSRGRASRNFARVRETFACRPRRVRRT